MCTQRTKSRLKKTFFVHSPDCVSNWLARASHVLGFKRLFLQRVVPVINIKKTLINFALGLKREIVREKKIKTIESVEGGKRRGLFSVCL